MGLLWKEKSVHLIKIAVVLSLVLPVTQYLFQCSNKKVVFWLVQSLCLTSPIDVVYTWVNGSDPDFLASMATYRKDAMDSDSKRFADWGTLKYSMRSIRKFAPWIRNIYLVTNGQVPNWLDINGSVKVVTHDQIFDDKEALPTFNSNAIELFLHKIPGLSDKFMFFNDDSLLGNNLKKEDVCHGYNGQKLYVSGLMVGLCKEGCRNERLGDGVCQISCNNPSCLHDKGDCGKPGVGVDNKTFDKSPNDKWYMALAMWNGIFNNDFEFAERAYPMHEGFLIDKHVKEDFNNKYKSFVNDTAFSKFRTGQDVQFQFTYTYYLISTSHQMAKKESFQDLTENIFEISQNTKQSLFAGEKINPRYNYIVANDEKVAGMVIINNDVKSVVKQLAMVNNTYICLQDNTNNPDSNITDQLFKTVTEFLKNTYPLKSDFEI